VVCGTEFGRTPAIQTANESVSGVVNGRDHNVTAFRSGWPVVASREARRTARRRLRFKAVEKKVHGTTCTQRSVLAGHRPHQADVSIQRARLPLTDTAGEVIHEIIA